MVKFINWHTQTKFKSRDTGHEYEPSEGNRGPPPISMVDALLETCNFVTDDGGQVYRYEAGPWVRLSDIALDQLALQVDRAGKSTSHRRRETISLLKAVTYDQKLTWGRVADNEIACANGIVDVLTGELRPHRPEHYLERVIPHDYQPGTQAPVWQQTHADWFGDGESDGSIEALEEFMGYICLSHAHYKRALMLYGPADCGKSQVVYALQGLVGTRYTCQLSVEHMDNPTRRAIIKGKALNVMTELPTDALIADAGFKTLVSTEEPIMLDEKYRPAEMYTPTTKHVIATNSLPRINDRTEATINRLMVIPMLRPIPVELQDKDLKRKLMAEMPGIFAGAVRGAQRLVARGGEWKEPGNSKDLMEEYRNELNPMLQFLREQCETAVDEAIPLEALALRFNKWNQGARKVTVRGVGQMLRRLSSVKQIDNVRHGGRVLKSLIGWRLHPDRDAPTGINMGLQPPPPRPEDL
jgi:putative DNA primase/helicase